MRYPTTQESIMAKVKTTHTAPAPAKVLQLRLINKEISRLTNAIHKAELAVITGWDQYHRGCPISLANELLIAQQLKSDLLVPFDHHASIREGRKRTHRA